MPRLDLLDLVRQIYPMEDQNHLFHQDHQLDLYHLLALVLRLDLLDLVLLYHQLDLLHHLVLGRLYLQ